MLVRVRIKPSVNQSLLKLFYVATCGERCLCVNRGDGSSIPPIAVSKRRQFCSPHICLPGISFRRDTTKKAGGYFYLVSMPGEVKDPTHGVDS